MAYNQTHKSPIPFYIISNRNILKDITFSTATLIMCKTDIGAFVVLRVYKNVTPSVIFTTQNSKDAHTYAEIMKRSEPEYDYAVGKVETLITNEQ